MPWDETDEHIRSGHQDKDAFRADSFRTITIDADRGIQAVIAKRPGSDATEVQSYLFAKAKGWTLTKAKAWFAAHVQESIAPVPTKEAFHWIGRVLPILRQVEQAGGKLVKIVAQHANIKNRNNRIYTDAELKQAARSLSFRPLDINHGAKLPAPLAVEINGIAFPINHALFSDYEDGRLETVAWVTDDIAERIARGDLVKASPEAVYLDNSQSGPDAERPAQLYFSGLALLDQHTPPGDPLTQVIMESTEGLRLFSVAEREHDHVCPDGQVWNPASGQCEPAPQPPFCTIGRELRPEDQKKKKEEPAKKEFKENAVYEACKEVAFSLASTLRDDKEEEESLITELAPFPELEYDSVHIPVVVTAAGLHVIDFDPRNYRVREKPPAKDAIASYLVYRFPLHRYLQVQTDTPEAWDVRKLEHLDTFVVNYEHFESFARSLATCFEENYRSVFKAVPWRG